MVTTQLGEGTLPLRGAATGAIAPPPLLFHSGLTSRRVHSDLVPCLCTVDSTDRPKPAGGVRMLRIVHSVIGVCELGCVGYLWLCVFARRRDRWLKFASSILIGEGIALTVARGCPLGEVQRRAGDDVSMFELWFGSRIAPLAVPIFAVVAITGFVLLSARPPMDG